MSLEMLLGTSQIGREKIVCLLSQQGSLTAQQMIARIYPKMSKQALYKELRNLMEDDVVIKVGKLFSLRFAWILKLQELSEKMYANSLKSAETLWLPFETKKSWKLRNIQQTLQLWSHLSMILFKTESDKNLFEYAPHAWYHLINSQVEEQFQNILKKEDIRFYLIVGNDSFLDRSYEKFFSISGKEISFAESQFSDLDQEYFSVIGECIIRIKFTSKLAREVHNLFGSIRRWGSEEMLIINKVLGTPAEIKLEITRNYQKAYKLKTQFSDFFGI